MNSNIKLYFKTLGVRSILYAIIGKATNSTLQLNVKRQDIMFPVNLRIPSSDVSTYEKVLIKQEYNFVAEKPPKTIIDAGANIGLASIYFTNKFPRALVIALEPEKSNFELLRYNVNPYKNIIPVNAALWNKNEEINLIDPGRGKWGFITEAKNGPVNPLGNFCHTVEGITIAKIIDDYHLTNIDVLKIDIEGAEKEVFEDTESWIWRVNALIIELHEHLKPGCNRSFYHGTNGFDQEWFQGENIYLARGECITRRST
jgi:FkbM family methyltransferase